MRTFYTYLYLREDGTPYYVGKGVGKRAFYKHHHYAPVPPRERILIQEFPSEADAFAAEVFLIAYYGREDLRTGCLLNQTNGGDGTSGRKYKMSEQQKRNISASVRGKKRTEESRRKISESHKGYKYGAPSEETRRKISEALTGKKRTPEMCRKNSELRKGHVHSTETRRKMSAAHRRRRTNG